MNRFKKIIDNALILAWGEHQGGHPFRVFRTEKARSLLQFLSDATNHIAILFGLTLTDVKSLQGQPVIHGSQLGTRSLTPLRIIHPLGGNGFSASSRLKTTVGDKFENCPVVDTPKGAKIPVTPKFVKVSKFHGITDIHAFNGFHSFYSFLRKTFFHTRYVLVTDKDTEKVSMPVYNLSVNKDESYVIPPGIVHNCRCTVVQVRKGKYPESNEQEAMKLGMEATAGKYREMFLFNPGKSMTCFPAYNAYTRRKCIHCKHRPGNMELAAEIDADALCHVCLQTQQEVAKDDNLYYKDEEFGDRLLISVKADKTEIEDNTKAAKSLLRSFSDMEVVIREHIIEKGVKNPEYLINGVLADRKGIESENGVASGFKKAIKQGCNIVVIDLDKNADKFPILRTRKLSSSINNRHADFENGSISECYVIFNGKAVKIGKELFNNNIMTVKENIYNILEKIKGDRSHP